VSRKLCVILALVFLLCVWGWSHNPEKRMALESKRTAAQDQIHNYESGLKLYETDNGRLPTTEQGLQALVALPTLAPVPGNWKGPYIRPPLVRKDPWNRDFIYLNPGHHNAAGYDLFSLGPNGISGSRDNIGN
jgi:general secretion pathway protein G